MDTRLKSFVTFLTFILLVSLFVSLLPNVSEARPFLSPLQGREGVIGEVNGVFRTLKDAGPSPGVGHKLKNLQKLHNFEDHKLNTVQGLGVIKHSGPSPGEGHKYITNNNNS
ncbi:hypothetical protein MtrunA17_Chr1g0208001 [Medicago truncatula]|uniref:Transmembrane protein, putative n=1 Tax=Medicago truncatula TaxID=3880 RepID=A0A072VRM5_MEDTR|nr:transmembrane protein, putative [Medicago truncatula]RHN82259.1 hypothetical protein MtrunA17_Chr1g0208001 [Medicago truncatula]